MFFRLSSLELGLMIFGVVLGTTLLGAFVGTRLRAHAETLREPFGVVQAALLGLVALVLAFGLTMAVGRYDQRRAAVVDDANAIGTTYLRAQTLHEPIRSESLDLLVRYTDASIARPLAGDRASAAGRVRERRRRPAADDRRGLVDELVVLEGRHHEEREVDAARLVALENRIAHVPAPHRQALALALLEIAPAHDRPARVAREHTPAGLHLVVEVGEADEARERAEDLHERPELPRVHVLAVERDVPPAGEDEPRSWRRVVEHGLGGAGRVSVDAPGDEHDERRVAPGDSPLDHLRIVGGARNDGDATLEHVELPHALLPAHADHLVAPVERVLHHVPPQLPRRADDADLHRADGRGVERRVQGRCNSQGCERTYPRRWAVVGCAIVTIERTRYFTGQLLDEADLTQEQLYFREKARRHNRMLHGWGIVSGLDVRPGPADGEVTVEPGYALDRYGDEIVVADAVIVDLLSEDGDGNAVAPCPQPDNHQPRRVRKRRSPGRPLYLAIRYAECASRPVPVGESVEYSRMRESFAVKVLTKLPASYRRRRPRGRQTSDSLAEPWVILAEVAFDLDLKVSTVDRHAHERRVAAPPDGADPPAT